MKQNAILILLLICSIGCRSSKENEKPESTPLYSVMCAPIMSDKDWYNSENIAPLFDGLGDLHFSVSTNNELAQKYFNQGLILAYGFNHAEAARSFHYASRLDSTCAMAYWGFAYVLGPNYNGGMEDDNYERAYTAIQRAIELSGKNSTELEKALILAMSKRYVKDPVEDRSDLDIAYAVAMKEVYTRYPENADIGAMYAESMMNLHPWDLFDKAGQPKEWTPEILLLLESLLKNHPRHPGIHHLYIHAVEASLNPERGLQSAQLFDDGLVPNSGHLIHMPSHIYIRTGDYHKGSLANIHAIKIDSGYISACNAQGAYPLAYFPHNIHFLAATATLEGNSKWALQAADEVSAHSNLQLMKEPGWGTIQHYYSIPYYVYVKFGKWDDILKMKNDVPELQYPSGILHYARGMAFLGKNDIESARNELKFLTSISLNEEMKEITVWEINTVYDLLQIAVKVLSAEISTVEKNYQKSIELLKEAIVIEDNLNYNEPPDWFFSVRHHLGAVQLKAGLYREAINTYEEDLKRLPKNGWALQGLMNAYAGLNDVKNLELTKTKFQKAWSHADISLSSSVMK